MLAVVQRVSSANVKIGARVTGSIGTGLLVLLGVEVGDTEGEAEYLARKIIDLRIFNDEDGKMNLTLEDVDGSLLVVSQFTLLGDCRKGRRPSFVRAAPPETGRLLYEYFVHFTRNCRMRVDTGIFGEMMEVALVNDGPVTLILDSRRTTGERIPIFPNR
ncbi:D-tyrosyl-tRNA(Tyr) deacylase [bacterium]|nr:D-tyrosyl-tRNA(Tyr) deacylase [candidate division CSSED10-310 bacterium]